MKSKEKRKILFAIILTLILVIILIIYNIYANRVVSYASNEKLSEEFKISKATKVDIEEIINKNQGEKNNEQIVTEEVDLE